MTVSPGWFGSGMTRRTAVAANRLSLMRTSLANILSIFTGSERRIEEIARMETLPKELSEHIFSLLTVRQLASATKVCRTWKSLTSQAELWKSLYVQRWGLVKAAAVIINPVFAGSWKSAYEVQYRCDRVGTEWNIIREGDSIYTTENGILLRCIVCPKHKSGSFCSDLCPVVQSKTSVESCREIGTTQMGKRTSTSGLLDKLLYFAADFQSTTNRSAKTLRICK